MATSNGIKNRIANRNRRTFARTVWEYISNIFLSKNAPRGAQQPFDDNYGPNRKTASIQARRRLERAYGMKGQSSFNAEELDELRQIFEFYDIDSNKTMDMR